MVAVELSTLLTGFRLVSAGQAANIQLAKETIKEKLPPQYGQLYDTVKSLIDNISVLDKGSIFEIKKDDHAEPIASPIVQALTNLYAEKFGIVYVMYAPPGQGKSFGAPRFPQSFLSF